MTPAQLRTALEARLQPLLGTYRWRNGSTRPAINIGDPDTGVEASGLEVVIETTQADPQRLHAHTIVTGVHPVRFIAHDGGDLPAAVAKVVQAFETIGSPVYIPPDEVLGIKAQAVVRVRT